MQKRTRNYAFEKGFEELRSVDRSIVRKEVMAVLNVKTEQAFGQYRRGERKLEVLLYNAIELIFTRYGVSSPWGFREDAVSYAAEVLKKN